MLPPPAPVASAGLVPPTEPPALVGCPCSGLPGPACEPFPWLSSLVPLGFYFNRHYNNILITPYTVNNTKFVFTKEVKFHL